MNLKLVNILQAEIFELIFENLSILLVYNDLNVLEYHLSFNQYMLIIL